MKVNQKNKVLNVNFKPSQNIKIENYEENNNKNINDNKCQIYKKITKPPELENFDTSFHLQHNILNYDVNCKDIITNQSYYCISCKQSVCISCGAYEHKDHILIQRDNCLFYDPNFFIEISKIIDNSLTIESRKQSIKDSIENSISNIKNHLDQLKVIKLNEIDEFFDKTNNNMKKLKKNFMDAKSCIENYYKQHKKFFNINYKSDNGNNNNNNIIEEELNKNLDIENTLFIMNFDLMNLCDSKNLKVLDKVNEITNKINLTIENINKKSSELIQIISNSYYLDLNIDKCNNYYDDIKFRIEKYSQIINQYQVTIVDIIKKNGNIEKIKELLEIFDSKNKKNKDIIFQQSFFQNENNENITPRLSNKQFKENENKLSSCKSNNSLLNSNNNTDIKDNNNLKVNLCSNQKGNKSNINTPSSKSAKKFYNLKKEKDMLSPHKNKINKVLSENSIVNLSNNNLVFSNKTISTNKINFNDIILDNRIIQRFFAYSISDFYKQNFLIDNSNKDEENINNKSFKKKNKSNINNSKNKENNFNIKKLNKKNKTSYNILNKNNIEEIDSNQYNIKSVAYLANYQNRYNSLKERAKPIIGTNQIQIFDQNTKKIIKKTTSLKKDEHGYSIFPDGCRHILIDNILYLTGGNNNCGHIVLSYDIMSNKLTRLSNFINDHSFHSLEYIDNFDCIVCIGGQNSTSCEIMDINGQKWKKLPSLNYPRANCNIYYNNINEQIYALFGLKGNLWDKNNKNSDKIEVLNLNLIDKGWVNLDYYKSIGLDLKVNFCKTMPFTKDKLIIVGGNNVRSIEEQNFYALFDMNKNEIIKVDKQTLELIKLEEKKMRAADLALTKIN